MEFQEALDLVFKLGGEIDFLWNSYIVVNVVIIGWLLSIKERANLKRKTIATIVYLIFISINLRALINTYAFLDVATEELKSIAHTMTFSTDAFREIIQHQSYNDRVRLTWVIHLIADSLMVFAIWYDKLWSKIRD